MVRPPTIACERIAQACGAFDRATGALNAATKKRKEAIAQAAEAGPFLSETAMYVGVSKQRVSQIVDEMRRKGSTGPW